MADNSILTPGSRRSARVQEESVDKTYLNKDNYLGEFEEDFEKKIVRDNLDVFGRDEVYTKEESELIAKEADKASMNQHLSQDDPHGILPQVDAKLVGIARVDGSTPFTVPQVGVDPVADLHLTTKRFVTELLKQHADQLDPHGIIELVKKELEDYILYDEVYLKNQTYSRSQVDGLINGYTKRDGTTPFTRPQVGIDPIADRHLATKKYVDKTLREHLAEVDPHGLYTYINNRLAAHYKKSDTYSKADTYSRTQIDSIVTQLVYKAAKEAVEEHVNSADPHGTIERMAEIEALLTKLQQTEKLNNAVQAAQTQSVLAPVSLNQLSSTFSDSISPLAAGDPIWITSGPPEVTVGFVQEGQYLPEQMTMQEILDAIFYGKAVDITAPGFAMVNTTVDVTMTIHGSLALVDYVELYQNGELIGTYAPEEFEPGNGSLTVTSKPILEDTTFVVVVHYQNGTVLEAQTITRVAYPIFVGIIPKWKFGSDVNYEFMLQQVTEDPANNEFDGTGDVIETINHSYRYSNTITAENPTGEVKIFVAVPASYPQLVEMSTQSQKFTIEAFDVINEIPVQMPGMNSTILYTYYIYKEPLVSIDLDVTFKFE